MELKTDKEVVKGLSKEKFGSNKIKFANEWPLEEGECGDVTATSAVAATPDIEQ